MRTFSENTLLLATHNAGKLEEFRQIMGPLGISVTSAAEYALPEPAETETSFIGNARIKAHAAAHATGLPALADDSGLEVMALDNAPGVYTADWAETPNGRDFTMAMEKTHAKLLERNAPQPWHARFCCTLVLAWPDGHEEVFEGFVHGQLVWPCRGQTGHGYDPMFQPEGSQRTFAEMTPDEKNALSHRGAAIAALLKGCFT
ncbi:RdgB/HAM1 family non-canonical purine NTP pyrophosphatase [Roseinatronobacter alkalisoli]|uniref:dITP/XTP pyrophosphatase n=1 Tax=Roseinatronobacter alkalisoli TaxID=3028235 RepID=A0ABT5T9W9_9RHOB|nr:RdgB/HAM1 family non-canonical purine NTP pyrophosphatase [Roseinatronobacter sp. HJB301]MDD7971874.1 RdgB/HAM1 family non-canonical purine NTP pyrophosphatase [Roseinatronobacter sp. HJB301]